VVRRSQSERPMPSSLHRVLATALLRDAPHPLDPCAARACSTLARGGLRCSTRSRRRRRSRASSWRGGACARPSARPTRRSARAPKRPRGSRRGTHRENMSVGRFRAWPSSGGAGDDEVSAAA
jgi:hypothetical protein